MAVLDALSTGDQVVEAFKSQVKGRTFVITGAGMPSIGSQMAISLARASPAHILIASRTGRKVDPVLEKIAEIDSSVKTTFVQVDLTDHESVRRAAKEILAATPKIDVLINSAGNMGIKDYTVDKQGIEIQLSANHIGHFLLTNLLAPALIAAGSQPGGARVVNLTSLGYRSSRFRFDDWNFSNGKTYDLWTGYAQAKTANILFSFGLTKKLKSHGVTSTAAHPGSNIDTQLGSHLTVDDYAKIPEVMQRNMGKEWEWETPRFKTFDQISSTSLAAALDPEIPAKSPAYMVNCQPHEVDEHARDPEAVEKLWKLSEELVGQKFDY
ncbi:NAD(P)-binding protein [Annulohypoxylon maeteangense]|uniref:NAD(P)-binding protein n=1 Tax=Annulohypoxylon maeteangense TaxID=1927788 RepID=UPI00200754E1|nr:NAD(P)-binding protein [Annulohypoxylon maeteangense]KAI0883107.1 NAD(P)-binding protein [Annulohypoxylon maeteangense]